MNAELSEDLKAERLQSILEELGPCWTVAQLRELLADLALEQEAALRTGGNSTSLPSPTALGR